MQNPALICAQNDPTRLLLHCIGYSTYFGLTSFPRPRPCCHVIVVQTYHDLVYIIPTLSSLCSDHTGISRNMDELACRGYGFRGNMFSRCDFVRPSLHLPTHLFEVSM